MDTTNKPITDPILCTNGTVHAKLLPNIKLSPGDPDLTPSATQWSLNVLLKINGEIPAFDTVENIFRSFLNGEFSEKFTKHAYEQTNSGFQVVFSGDPLQRVEGSRRREVEQIDVDANLMHDPSMNYMGFFSDFLNLLEEGFTSVFKKMAKIAPLVFDEDQAQLLKSVIPLIKPLCISLDLDPKANVLEKIVERGLVDPMQISNRRSGKKKVDFGSNLEDELSETKAKYFPQVEFEQRKFMVVADDGACSHEPCYFQNLSAAK